MSIKCPSCGLINPDSALLCDCGYNFDTGIVDSKQALVTDPTSPATQGRGCAVLFWLIGAGVVFGLLTLQNGDGKLPLPQILFYGITVFIAFMNTLSDHEASGKISWIVGAVFAVVIGYSVPSISGSWLGVVIGPILLFMGAGLTRVVYR